MRRGRNPSSNVPAGPLGGMKRPLREDRLPRGPSEPMRGDDRGLRCGRQPFVGASVERGDSVRLLGHRNRDGSGVSANHRHGKSRAAVDSRGTPSGAGPLVVGFAGDHRRKPGSTSGPGTDPGDDSGLVGLGRDAWLLISSRSSATPRLVEVGFSETSPATPRYNCLAWAAGQTDQWWWPDRFGAYDWPEAAPREETIEGFRVRGK